MEIVKSNILFTLEEDPYRVEVESIVGPTGEQFYDAWLRHKNCTIKIMIQHEFAPAVGTPQAFIDLIEEELEESIDAYNALLEESAEDDLEDEPAIIDMRDLFENNLFAIK